jgi:uncharacterized protein (TIGR02246 family)
MATDEQVIQGILQQIETAWNRYDGASLAAVFTEDANFIQIFGGQLDGRAAIEAAHRTFLRRSTAAAAPASCYGASAFCAPMSRWYSPERM